MIKDEKVKIPPGQLGHMHYSIPEDPKHPEGPWKACCGNSADTAWLAIMNGMNFTDEQKSIFLDKYTAEELDLKKE